MRESIIYSHMFLPDNLITLPPSSLPLECMLRREVFELFNDEKVIKMGVLSTTLLYSSANRIFLEKMQMDFLRYVPMINFINLQNGNLVNNFTVFTKPKKICYCAVSYHGI